MENQVREPLPYFRYHPDSLATGMVQESDTVCIVCGRSRGYIYVGPVFALEEYLDEICPWCIADGTAHSTLDADFTDIDSIQGGGTGDHTPRSVKEEIAYRTPGFNGWQQEQWLTHCGDAAAFQGIVGYRELEELGPEAIQAIRDDTGFRDDAEWERFYHALDKDGSPTAYIFRCLHCGKYDGYTDCD